MKPGGAIARSIKEAEKSGWKLSGVCYRSYEHWMRKQVASSSTTFSGKTQTGEGEGRTACRPARLITFRSVGAYSDTQLAGQLK